MNSCTLWTPFLTLDGCNSRWAQTHSGTAFSIHKCSSFSLAAALQAAVAAEGYGDTEGEIHPGTKRKRKDLEGDGDAGEGGNSKAEGALSAHAH